MILALKIRTVINVHMDQTLVWKSRRFHSLTLSLKDLIRPNCLVDLLEMLVVVACGCFVFEYEPLGVALAAAVGFFLQVVGTFHVDRSE
ncbi:hypothetical protein PGIGA_G00209250 [Pangasianodon gigas]|uniref:Uncharacterized protein n=1 Tax=Pangasianodon gigas TaxID=30993 RepID=A0ACC5WH33_PANGG|nr:hypothetical protein [Pangasianodon gigas]